MKSILLAVCMFGVAMSLVIFTGGLYPTADNNTLVNSDTYVTYMTEDITRPAQPEPVNVVLVVEAEEDKKS